MEEHYFAKIIILLNFCGLKIRPQNPPLAGGDFLRQIRILKVSTNGILYIGIGFFLELMSIPTKRVERRSVFFKVNTTFPASNGRCVKDYPDLNR